MSMRDPARAHRCICIMYTYLYTLICSHTSISIHVSYLYSQLYSYSYTYVYMYMHIHTHICIHIYIYMCVNSHPTLMYDASTWRHFFMAETAVRIQLPAIQDQSSNMICVGVLLHFCTGSRTMKRRFKSITCLQKGLQHMQITATMT